MNGITFAGLLFVVASGFTLAFGLMRVVNMAHGSLYLLGGYFAFEIQDQGDVFTGGEPKHSWWLSAITASLLIGIIGLLIQQLLLRWNQGEMLQQALITIAVSVIAADQMLAHFGGLPEAIKKPPAMEGVVRPAPVRRHLPEGPHVHAVLRDHHRHPAVRAGCTARGWA